MNTCPINTTGFLIDAEVAAYIYLCLDIKDGDVPAEIQAVVNDGTFAAKAKTGTLPCDYSDIPIAVDTLSTDVCFCNEFTGEIEFLFPEKVVSPIDINYENDHIIFFEIARKPNLFRAAYESPDELLREFQEMLAECDIELPEDFDWWAHIVAINGTYFC